MMKKIALTTALALSAFAHAADYKIDPHHTNARFAIDHFGASTNTGGFYGIEGTLSFDPQAGTGAVDVTIPLASLNTGNKDFDNHMKSADLFEAEKFPEMRFVSSKWHFEDGKVSQVDGDLTIMGKTHPVSLKASKFGCYDNPILKARVCGGDFETTLDRTQWGMNFLLEAGIPKDVHVMIQIEAAQVEEAKK